MDVVFEIAGDQVDGARDYQEDAFLTTYLDDDAGDSKSSAVVVMADGMGGHAAGNIASNLVVSTFNKSFTGNFGKQSPSEILREALEKANGAIAVSDPSAAQSRVQTESPVRRALKPKQPGVDVVLAARGSRRRRCADLTRAG